MTDRQMEVARSALYIAFAVWSTVAAVAMASKTGWTWVHVAVLGFNAIVLSAGVAGLITDFRRHGAHLLMAAGLIAFSFCLLLVSGSPFSLLTFALGVQEAYLFRAHQSPAEKVAQRGSGDEPQGRVADGTLPLPPEARP